MWRMGKPTKRHASEAGVRLRLLRLKAGITGHEIERLTDMQRGHVAVLESRPNARTPATTLLPLARLLGTTVAWLVSGEGVEPTRAQILDAIAAARAARGEQAVAS